MSTKKNKINMKTIVSFLVIMVMSVMTSFAQVNLSKFENFVVQEINRFRLKNNVDTLVVNDSLKLIADVESDFISNVGRSTPDPYFVNNMENVFGEQVHKSFNSNLVAHWNTKNFDSFEDIEIRMAEGYILQVIDDKMTSIILKSFQSTDPSYKEYIAVKSKIVDGVVYMSVVLYMTNYN